MQLLQHLAGWQHTAADRHLGNNAMDGGLRSQPSSHSSGSAGKTAAGNSMSLFLTIKQANMTPHTKGDPQNRTAPFL